MRILKRKNGFTLVELLVVLVILAVLAAAVIPSMMGFIDEARRNEYILQCRNCVISTKVLVNERYGRGETGDDLYPTFEEIKTLADVPGTVSDVELSAPASTRDATATPLHPELLHLTYTQDGTNVTYCAHHEDCTIEGHDDTYNIIGSTGGGEGGEGSGSGESGGETPSDGSVTLKDSLGNPYTIKPNTDWNDLKAAIASSDGINLKEGTIISDENGTYLIYKTSQPWLKDPDAVNWTPSQLVEKYSGIFMKIEDDMPVWTTADLTNNNQKWTSAPPEKSIAYINGKYYVAPQQIGEWSIPPGAWIAFTSG